MRAKDLIEVVADSIDNGETPRQYSCVEGTLAFAEARLHNALARVIDKRVGLASVLRPGPCLGDVVDVGLLRRRAQENTRYIAELTKTIDALIAYLDIELVAAHTEPMKFIKRKKEK